MSILDTNEKIELLATQSLNYDRYCAHQYFLERVEVNGKYGLICREQSDESGVHTRVLLPAFYDDIKITRISSDKAIYKKYVVIANGLSIAQFTFILNAWVPIVYLKQDVYSRFMNRNSD